MADLTGGDCATVLIPAYRPSERLNATLASLAAQSHRQLRIQLSLDHAPDHPLPVLPTMPGLTIHRQPRRLGWVAQVNWLLATVDTPFFMVLAHDDCLSSTFIAECVQALHDRPECVVAHGRTRHFGVRDGDLAATPAITGRAIERVLEFIRRGPHHAELGWRGLARSTAIATGLRLRTRRSDGQFSNTLWALELLTLGESSSLPQVYYDKHTDPAQGLSREFHRRDSGQKSAMLADNLACVVDVLRNARFSDAEQLQVLAAYAQWLLCLEGNWDVLGTPAAEMEQLRYRQARPALANFLANAMVSLATPQTLVSENQ